MQRASPKPWPKCVKLLQLRGGLPPAICRLQSAEPFCVTMHTATPNSLQPESGLPLNYPPFDRIRDDDFAPALHAGMAEQAREIEAIAQQSEAPSFANTIEALERSGRGLARACTLLFSLIGTDANPARLQLQSEFAAPLAAHADALLLNSALFARIDTLHATRHTLGLDAPSLRLLEKTHQRFVRAGARLNEADQARVRAINTELAQLGARFNQALLAESNDAALLVEREEELAGLSPAQIAAARQAAEAAGHAGQFLLPLLNTSTQPLLTQLDDRAVRERLLKASLARGSRGNAHDSTGLVSRTLQLRAERAALLGFAHHAAFVLEDETAGTPDAVMALLRQLAPAAMASARREAAALQALIDEMQDARKEPRFELAAWDWAYYSERLSARICGFDDSQLKPYLELGRVLEHGVFFAAERLYGLHFQRRFDLPTHHPDVRVYEVFDADGRVLALFTLDAYARPAKRGGAWMHAWVGQSELLNQQPVIANTLNIAKPPEGEPTLLGWDEVRTLFHEFGHALHGMFSKVRHPSFSGTHVPRDFVEFPSQVNEIWAEWPEVLAQCARHHRTGEPMPTALVDQLLAAGQFNQGCITTAYLSAALLDQRLHALGPAEVPSAETLMAFEAQVLKEEGFDAALIPPRYRTPYFNHIMGGYAAAYYAYIWAEVLDAHAADWFKTNGGLDRRLGELLRQQLLCKGGSEDPMQMFRHVVGQDPDIRHLLQRRGLMSPS